MHSYIYSNPRIKIAKREREKNGDEIKRVEDKKETLCVHTFEKKLNKMYTHSVVDCTGTFAATAARTVLIFQNEQLG